MNISTIAPIGDEFLLLHFDELEEVAITLRLSGVEAISLVSSSENPICQKIKSQIHQRICQMVGIRIEGQEQEIEEVLRRFKHIFDLVNSSSGKTYDSRRDAGKKLCYCRAYLYSKNSLLDQLEAAQTHIRDLETQNGELLLEIVRLKEQLGITLKPRPDDVVLGGKNE